MKDEIKEILDKLKSLDYDEYNLEFSVDYIERKEEKLLLDCITNLQKENKQLKNKINSNEKSRRKMQKTLQQRIDKAIEYIKDDLALTEGFTIYEDGAKKLLNILGGDEE